MDSLTNFLKGPGLGRARLLRFVPSSNVPVAFTGRADAHLLFMRAIAAMASITTGAHVVDGLKRKRPLREVTNASRVQVEALCAFAYLE